MQITTSIFRATMLLFFGVGSAIACRHLIEIPTEHDPNAFIFEAIVIGHEEISPERDFSVLARDASLQYSLPHFSKSGYGVVVKVDTSISSPVSNIDTLLILPFSYGSDCSMFLPSLEDIESEYPIEAQVQVVALNFEESELFQYSKHDIIYCCDGKSTRMAQYGFHPQYEIRRFLKELVDAGSYLEKKSILNQISEGGYCPNSKIRVIIKDHFKNPVKRWLLLREYK